MTDLTNPEAIFYQPGTTGIGDRVKFTVARYGRFLTLANDGISQLLRLYGEWAQAEVEFLLNLVEPGDTVLDIGANLGTITIPLAKRVGPTGQVVAFEAQPIIHMLLTANLALNELLSARAFNVAVGDRSGFIDVPNIDYAAYGNFGGVSFVDQTISAQAGATRIACASLDSLLPDLRSCRLIKIDVEGMEPAVLVGGCNFIERHRPLLYCEADRRSTFGPIRDFAATMRYRAYWHCFKAFNPNNFFGTQENYYGDGGDVNLLLVPNERDQHIVGRVAREFDEIFELMPGIVDRY